ncbi:MAG TPA: hypothetical protein VNK43_08105 [Gemmatimonadales bacterium]|nr:hypothetical protein [Gemmatimonadales bacterium]
MTTLSARRRRPRPGEPDPAEDPDFPLSPAASDQVSGCGGCSFALMLMGWVLGTPMTVFGIR